MTTINQDAILATIPHRDPFLFIDSIESLSPEGLIAKRSVTGKEPFFAGHYPGNPIMPGVLLCEAVFQAGAYFLAKRLETMGVNMAERVPVLCKIEQAKFSQKVVPGDTLTIQVEFLEEISGFFFLKGDIKNQLNKRVLSLKCALSLVDKTHFA